MVKKFIVVGFNLLPIILLVLANSHSLGQYPSCDLAIKAESLENPFVRYSPGYVSIPYPNGDVPAETGVCTDVVIRAFRLIEIDLQKEVHEDMVANFEAYPQNWGMSSTDKNIDHRRVPNLMTYFERQGWSEPITNNKEDYLPGDIVAWNLGNGLTHIGIVTSKKNNSGGYLVIHNIGGGQVIEDVLFSYSIIGHYRRA